MADSQGVRIHSTTFTRLRLAGIVIAGRRNAKTFNAIVDNNPNISRLIVLDANREVSQDHTNSRRKLRCGDRWGKPSRHREYPIHHRRPGTNESQCRESTPHILNTPATLVYTLPRESKAWLTVLPRFPDY